MTIPNRERGLDGRAAPQVPLVALPDSPSLPAHETGFMGEIGSAINSLSNLKVALQLAVSRGAQIDEALNNAVDSMRHLAAVTASALPAVSTEAPAIPVHKYFGVVARPLTTHEHFAQTTTIFFRVLADLRDALLDINEIYAELAAIEAILKRIHEPLPFEVGQTQAGSSVRQYEPSGDGLERWIVVHHAYFLMNVHAASCVNQAARIAESDQALAASLLEEASVYVRGFSAAMMHSAAVPSSYYGDVIRPTMHPPAVPVVLTGTMQPEHASYRAALETFLHACGEPFLELVQKNRALALARDHLLDADLLDIEKHTCVASALVGNEHSLIQNEDSPGNAVSALRRMRHERAARYCPLMRFGDAAVASMRMKGAGA
jgi:hypothetical protein